jgi:DNA-binding transcriptional ArsR family regulator
LQCGVHFDVSRILETWKLASQVCGFRRTWLAMDEAEYRQSRLCRLLGNPVVYQLVVLLDNGGSMTPSALAKLAGRSVQTVSGHLAKLRAADLVRYDTVGKEVRYWLKHRDETRGLLKALEKVVYAAGKLS